MEEPLEIVLTYEDTPETPTKDPKHIATCGEYSVTTGSSGAPVCKLCRLLVSEGVPEDTVVVVTRNGRVSLLPKPISYWAGLTVRENFSECVRMIPYKPFKRFFEDD